jgi:hypothetical protein
MKMKIKIILLTQFLFTFLFSTFNLFAEVEENDNMKILTRLTARAKLFGKILENGEPTDLVKMFKPNHPDNTIIIITLMPVDKETAELKRDRSDYEFYIGNSNMIQPYFYSDSVFFNNFRNVDEPNNTEQIVSFCTEYGKFWGKSQYEIFFSKKGTPTQCEIIYNALHKEGEQLITSSVEWDNNGNIVMKKDLHLMTEKKVTAPLLPRSLTEKFSNKQNINPSKTFLSCQPVQFPKVTDKKVSSTFKRIEYLADMKKPRDLSQLFKWELTKKNSHGSIQCINGKVRDIVFSASSQGYFLSLDENGKILAYAEGELYDSEGRKFEDFYKKREDSRHYYWYFLNSFAALTKGVEVKFHSNGYPASYRTVVNSRLYGRQIEWNDKGEVVSDIDLDIPKEWKDAQKRNESQPK